MEFFTTPSRHGKREVSSNDTIAHHRRSHLTQYLYNIYIYLLRQGIVPAARLLFACQFIREPQKNLSCESANRG